MSLSLFCKQVHLCFFFPGRLLSLISHHFLLQPWSHPTGLLPGLGLLLFVFNAPLSFLAHTHHSLCLQHAPACPAPAHCSPAFISLLTKSRLYRFQPRPSWTCPLHTPITQHTNVTRVICHDLFSMPFLPFCTPPKGRDGNPCSHFSYHVPGLAHSNNLINRP